MAEKIGAVLKELPLLPRALGLVWESARRWMIAWLTLLLVQGLLPVATVFLTRTLVDGLADALGAGYSWEVLRRPLLLALAMAGLLLTTEVLSAITGWVRTVQAELVGDHVRFLIHERAGVADLAFFESPDYFDKLHRARADAHYRPSALVENLGDLLQSGLTLVAMAGVLMTFGWWLPVVLLVSTLPAFLVVVRYAVRHHQWRLRTTTEQRRTLYYEQLLTVREAFPELRLFSLGCHFRERFKGLRKKLRGERLDLARSEALAHMLAGLVALLMMAAALGWMVIRAVRGGLSLGDLAMFYQAFSQGQKLMRALLQTVGQIYSNSLFLGNLFEFLQIQPTVTDPAQPRPLPAQLVTGIDFRNVSFTYPGSEKPVLADFNLSIPVGQVVALLGRNGAGKSTLFKLLCRFYDLDSGAISIDGINISDLRSDELRRRLAVLFQEPMHFSTTVARNISYGKLDGCDRDQIIHAASAAGCQGLQALPEGFDTMLGRWFGGTELSVGEWQRIALARSFVRSAEIVLLDEPTSAMDSWSEADWMDRFRALVADRTAIIITHRLTTAMRADIIHVIEEGRIAESGSHQDLLHSNGRYQAAWKSQIGPGCARSF